MSQCWWWLGQNAVLSWCLYKKHQVELWTAVAFRRKTSVPTLLKALKTWESIWHKHYFTFNMVGFAAVNMKVAWQGTQGLWHRANGIIFESTASCSKHSLLPIASQCFWLVNIGTLSLWKCNDFWHQIKTCQKRTKKSQRSTNCVRHTTTNTSRNQRHCA